MIRNISDSVVIPDCGNHHYALILCYELISDADGTEQSARCRHMDVLQVDFVKMWIAVYLDQSIRSILQWRYLTLAQSVVNSASGIIRGNTAIDISVHLAMQMQAAMATMAIGELVTLALETLCSVSMCV